MRKLKWTTPVVLRKVKASPGSTMIVSRVGASPPPTSPRTSVSHFPSAAYSPVRVIHAGLERATYSPFRQTIFQDPTVNPRLRGDGGETDGRASARESKRLWTSNGPLINPRTVKTATCPGSAFKNEALSADRLYSTNRNSLGYDVHKSLRGTSLCSTTKRFDQKARTPESVGPGSYNLNVVPCRQIHHPPKSEPPKSSIAVVPSDRLKQWGGPPDQRPMDNAEEWKTTSEKPAPTVYTFQRARQATWIEQIEEHQRRYNPQARRLPTKCKRQGPEQMLPCFLQGNRNPISTKAGSTMLKQQNLQHPKARSKQEAAETPRPPSPLGLSFDSLDRQALDSAKGFLRQAR